MNTLDKLKQVVGEALTSECVCPDDGLPHENHCKYSNAKYKFSNTFNPPMIKKLLSVVEASIELKKYSREIIGGEDEFYCADYNLSKILSPFTEEVGDGE